MPQDKNNQPSASDTRVSDSRETEPQPHPNTTHRPPHDPETFQNFCGHIPHWAEALGGEPSDDRDQPASNAKAISNQNAP